MAQSANYQAAAQRTEVTGMPTTTGTSHVNFRSVEKKLLVQRDELHDRLAQHRKNVSADREPDDELAEASDNFTRAMMISELEREQQTLREIESALARLKSGDYGSCEMCGAPIPEARLRALPWARYCVHCAERK